MREQGIQSNIIKALEKNGAYVAKVMTASKAGTPDLLACAPVVITQDMVGQTIGAFVGIEVKAEKGVVSELQKYHGNLIEKAGGRWTVARSIKDVLVFFGKIGD